MQVIACLEVFGQHASIGVRHLAMLRTQMGFPETRPLRSNFYARLNPPRFQR